MAPGIGLGFLVGSLLLLGVVLYYTRIRNPAVPHAGTVETDGTDGTTQEVSGTQVCELCEREQVCHEAGDLTVCAECNEELMA
jgi:hypothetical protein